MILTSKAGDVRRMAFNALAMVQPKYVNNLKIMETWTKGKRMRFVLRAHNSREHGARLSASGRHTPSVSWEAHRDFMRAVFEQDANARIETGLAIYRGSDDFEAKYLATGHKNIGSQMHPCTMRECSL